MKSLVISKACAYYNLRGFSGANLILAAPMERLKISVAASAGFCFGVKRAIRIALATVAQAKKVEMLGDIVHNEDVVHQIQEAGIRKVQRLSAGTGKVLLIRAHGAAQRTIAKAQMLGYRIVDATCPMVKEIHRIVKERESQGYRCIIIGDRDHEEVQGIQGQLAHRALVIDSVASIPKKIPKAFMRAAVVVQSTQNSDSVFHIIQILRSRITDLQVHNTICRATKKRQEEIKTMPLAHDVMLIIGSRTSANTKRLYEIARSLNPRSYWIQSYHDIEPAWFTGAARVGITAGASTPEHTIHEVVATLKRLNA